MALLTEDQIRSALAALNAGTDAGWVIENKFLCKAFEFADFKAAFAFMSALAQYAECVDHHPDWRNCYRRVEIRLTTFDVRGLSQQDFDFALEAENQAAAEA